MKTILLIITIVLQLFIVTALYSAEVSGTDGKTARITWEEGGGIIRYDVKIKNSLNQIVMEKSVNTAQVDFSLPAGVYWIQITAVNKFEKVDSESDWQKFEMTKAEKIRDKKYVTNLRDIGLKISVGWFYQMPLDLWSDLYYNSFLNGFLRLSLNFGNLGALKNYKFFKYFGLEVDASYARSEGKKQNSQIKFSSQYFMGGGNIFFTTGLQVPINFYLRLGCGAAYTNFEYQNSLISDKKYSLWSTDPYLLGGLSIEITYYEFLFIEVGADFIYVAYAGDGLKCLRYFASVGIRL